MVFTTVSDYLFNLRAFAEALHPFGPHAMFYLAAAVSDFYVPSSQMASAQSYGLLVLFETCPNFFCSQSTRFGHLMDHWN